MRIHYIQHVHFETPANIYRWADYKKHQIEGTKLFLNDPFPDIGSFDLLVILGGPMGVYDEDEYPWLKDEKKFIERSIKSGKKILGICLGAQLIADVLGGKVYKNRYKEIGWFDVQLTSEGKKSKFFSDLPERFTAFHWHGDTFEIPDGAVHTARSEACENQAFVYEDRVVGLQFHLETDLQTAKGLIENSEEELKEKGIYIQSPEYILSREDNFNTIEKLLYRFMDRFED
ncbi:MAG TPA: type 1 glutamine amidotransferase [Persephonella sp.]|uniref:Glutamine amidotransferase class-I n=1 Tax=Persephonella marina (strain DSM 14350 / EX-H1) TaxID=123214 RepID=C0QPT3_PERMH|nr:MULTISPECIES: type 1 glutamine amidotransferase [Persephonella]ACO03419.1 glutamine amidotransferase class-I [Persephonella marina EX-H1]HCB69706.1 type 1 glutamine amidotransferase [Persephonella sp.]